MPRKPPNPAVQVLAYFESAELDTAETILELAGAVVRNRQPAAPPPPSRAKRSHHKKKPTPPADVALELGGGPEPSATVEEAQTLIQELHQRAARSRTRG